MGNCNNLRTPLTGPSLNCGCGCSHKLSSMSGKAVRVASQAINTGGNTYSKVLRLPNAMEAQLTVVLLSVSNDMDLECVLQGSLSQNGTFADIGSSMTLNSVGEIGSLKLATAAYPFLRVRFSSTLAGVTICSAEVQFSARGS